MKWRTLKRQEAQQTIGFGRPARVDSEALIPKSALASMPFSDKIVNSRLGTTGALILIYGNSK
ncbi:MAG TPA: hypothetical protein VFY06_14140 [Verrucomicrobiae bacterium]|nr:hypothetical protein [Verrucomicrobiae bacterium]